MTNNLPPMLATLNTESGLEKELGEMIGGLTELSPYKISRILSVKLNRNVQGPHIYSYRNKKSGYVSEKNSSGKWTVKKDEAIRFMTEFINKNS